MSDYRADFPILSRQFYEKPFVYLDSAATTQKPRCVIEAVNRYYTYANANVHRGIYRLSEEATEHYESARLSVRSFLNADAAESIVWTRGTTEAINLVASSYGQQFIAEGDEIIISTLEHHSNIVPWQLLCERTGAILKVIPMSDAGVLDVEAYQRLLTQRVKMVALVHVSNALGTLNPIKQMIAMAHSVDIPVLIDGAQAVSHLPVDVTDLDCDFYVFSSHKMYGPTGVGVLYAKPHWLEQMPPYQAGGDMIRTVTFEKTEYARIPHKFEAGTPNMAGIAGLQAAIKYLNDIGYAAIVAHERKVYAYAQAKLAEIPGIKIIGTAAQKVGALSFISDTVHPHDLSTILDQHAVAIRAGHHCAMPLMQRLQLAATARISFGLYNQYSDIDYLCEALNVAVELFHR